MPRTMQGYGSVKVFGPDRWPRVTRAGGGFAHTFKEDDSNTSSRRQDWLLRGCQIIPQIGVLTLAPKPNRRNHWPEGCNDEAEWKSFLVWDDVTDPGTGFVTTEGRYRTGEQWKIVSGYWVPSLDASTDRTGIAIEALDGTSHLAQVQTTQTWPAWCSLLWDVWMWEARPEDVEEGTQPYVMLRVGNRLDTGGTPVPPPGADDVTSDWKWPFSPQPSPVQQQSEPTGYSIIIPRKVQSSESDEVSDTDVDRITIRDNATWATVGMLDDGGETADAGAGDTGAVASYRIEVRWLSRDVMMVRCGDGDPVLIDASLLTHCGQPMLFLEVYGLRVTTAVTPIQFPSSGIAVKTYPSDWGTWQSANDKAWFNDLSFQWNFAGGPVTVGSDTVAMSYARDDDEIGPARVLGDAPYWVDGDSPLVKFSLSVGARSSGGVTRLGTNLYSPTVGGGMEFRAPTTEDPTWAIVESDISEYVTRATVTEELDGRGSKAEFELADYGTALDEIYNGSWVEVSLGQSFCGEGIDDEERVIVSGFLRLLSPQRNGQDRGGKPVIQANVQQWDAPLQATPTHLYNGVSFGGLAIETALLQLARETGYPANTTTGSYLWFDTASGVSRKKRIPGPTLTQDGLQWPYAYDDGSNLLDAMTDLCEAVGYRLRVRNDGMLEVFKPARWDGVTVHHEITDDADATDESAWVSSVEVDELNDDLLVSAVLHRGKTVDGYSIHQVVFDTEAAWDRSSPFYQGGAWRWSVSSDDGNYNPAATVWQEWERIRRHRIKLRWNMDGHPNWNLGDYVRARVSGLRLHRHGDANTQPEVVCEIIQKTHTLDAENGNYENDIVAGVVSA